MNKYELLAWKVILTGIAFFIILGLITYIKQ